MFLIRVKMEGMFSKVFRVKLRTSRKIASEDLRVLHLDTVFGGNLILRNEKVIGKCPSIGVRLEFGFFRMAAH